MSEKIETGSEQQIKRDLKRSFPHDEFFRSSEGREKLERVLHAFAKYETKVGYVQGMNFIAGSLLYHCNEEVVFWLIVTLMEDHELREVYQPGLSGLYKHCQCIESLVEERLPHISEHFKDCGLQVEMYASDWIFGMYCSIIPLDKLAEFWTNFFERGWAFFY